MSERAWRTVKAVCTHGCHNVIPYGTEFSVTHSQDSTADDEGSSGPFPTRNGLLVVKGPGLAHVHIFVRAQARMPWDAHGIRGVQPANRQPAAIFLPMCRAAVSCIQCARTENRLSSGRAGGDSSRGSVARLGYLPRRRCSLSAVPEPSRLDVHY